MCTLQGGTARQGRSSLAGIVLEAGKARAGEERDGGERGEGDGESRGKVGRCSSNQPALKPTEQDSTKNHSLHFLSKAFIKLLTMFSPLMMIQYTVNFPETPTMLIAYN